MPHSDSKISHIALVMTLDLTHTHFAHSTLTDTRSLSLHIYIKVRATHNRNLSLLVYVINYAPSSPFTRAHKHTQSESVQQAAVPHRITVKDQWRPAVLQPVAQTQPLSEAASCWGQWTQHSTLTEQTIPPRTERNLFLFLLEELLMLYSLNASTCVYRGCLCIHVWHSSQCANLWSQKIFYHLTYHLERVLISQYGDRVNAIYRMVVLNYLLDTMNAQS